MLNFLKKLVREEEGQDFVEYGLLLAGIAVAATGAVFTLGEAISTLLGSITFSN